jgi:hypothetical protein
MNQRAQKVWHTFCAELTYPSSEDQAQALATVLRMIIDEYESWEDGTYMVKSSDIAELADELDK